MATSKLTLSIDNDTKELEKMVAAESKISVSKLFKNLITDIAKKKKVKDPLLEKIKSTDIPDWIKQLTVVSEPVPDFDHKAEYGKHLEKKYGA